MSNMQLMRKAISLFNNPLTEKKTNRHNQRSWISSVRVLGDNWILADKIQKIGQ